MKPQSPAGQQERPPRPPAHTPAGSRRSVRSRPPHNPGLQRLIDGKQAWAEPLDGDARARGFLGWHQRGYLPHCDMPGVFQLVTFRLRDAMPASRRSEWEVFLRLEHEQDRRKAIEAYLDRGLGQCWLRDPTIAGLAEGALAYWNGERYRLEAWVVMPNHVHVLVEVWQTPLAEMVKSWKQQIARQANRALGLEGPFWQREYWDTKMKDNVHELKARRYIELNPVKAGLVGEAKEWGWSSARFRDEYGILRFPIRSAGFPAGFGSTE